MKIVDAKVINGQVTLNFALEPGHSVTFRYRVLIISGEAISGEMDSRFGRFAAEAN